MRWSNRADSSREPTLHDCIKGWFIRRLVWFLYRAGFEPIQNQILSPFFKHFLISHFLFGLLFIFLWEVSVKINKFDSQKRNCSRKKELVLDLGTGRFSSILILTRQIQFSVPKLGNRLLTVRVSNY